MKDFFVSIKFYAKKLIEKVPFINQLILNNLNFFYYFLPHEKDFLGLQLVPSKLLNKDIIDVGANFGQSTVSFRKIGFIKNKIFLFEANCELFIRLNKIKKNFKKIFIFRFGLSNKNKNEVIYIPEIKNIRLTPLASLNIKSLKNQLKVQFPNNFKNFKIKKREVKLKKFDSLKLSIKPSIIKIDVEGHEHEVISGMKNLISLHKPLLLVEYNKVNFVKIYTQLKKDYSVYLYFFYLKRFKKFSKKTLIQFYKKNTKFHDIQKPRNIYFISKKLEKKIKYKIC